MIYKRNKGKAFQQETKGLFYKEIIRSFPQEIRTSCSSGKFVKHYIMCPFAFGSQINKFAPSEEN
jgi:hypothetical protein